jgi:enoyl-CoA hydratase
MSDPAPLVIGQDGAVGIVELARPAKFNSLTIAMTTGLQAAFDAFERPDSGVRAVLVRAQGRNFCTGADLDEVVSLRRDADAVRRFIAPAQQALRRLEASPLPVVAACQGLALAGGLELMLACDVAIAADDARFGDQHAQYGLLPGFGGSQRLPRIVGLRRALDLLFSARWIDAATALQWGLVSQVVAAEVLAGTALDYCRSLATRSRPGLAAMKRLVRSGLDGSLDAGLALEERTVVTGLLDNDVSEGLEAFRSRRAPRFAA